MSDERPGVTRNDGLLRRTARAAATRQGFLAAVFARYHAAERIDEEELARRLGVTRETLDAIALCRPPRADRFAADIVAIGDRFHADRAALANIVRHVAALDALSGAAGEAMLAARDADDTPPEDES